MKRLKLAIACFGIALLFGAVTYLNLKLYRHVRHQLVADVVQELRASQPTEDPSPEMVPCRPAGSCFERRNP